MKNPLYQIKKELISLNIIDQSADVKISKDDDVYVWFDEELPDAIYFDLSTEKDIILNELLSLYNQQ